MKVFYCDEFVLPLPAGHRFPMVKYAMLRERVARGGIAEPGEMLVPAAATDGELVLAHDPGYVARVAMGTLSAAEVRRIGFPWTPALVERSRRSVGGTIGAARAALEDGAAANLAGGTHHAFADRGEGFCVFNDVAVAARVLQHQGRIGRAAVLDCDVHQGDGTASIFRDDPSVFTLSIHGAGNYPFEKQRSDLDLELPDDAGDDAYLEAVEAGVRHALAASSADLAFYIAGADPHVADRLGRLAVSRAALAERDRIIHDACGRLGIPVALVMGGGYGERIEETVEIHYHSVAEAAGRVRG